MGNFRLKINSKTSNLTFKTQSVQNKKIDPNQILFMQLKCAAITEIIWIFHKSLNAMLFILPLINWYIFFQLKFVYRFARLKTMLCMLSVWLFGSRIVHTYNALKNKRDIFAIHSEFCCLSIWTIFSRHIVTDYQIIKKICFLRFAFNIAHTWHHSILICVHFTCIFFCHIFPIEWKSFFLINTTLNFYILLFTSYFIVISCSSNIRNCMNVNRKWMYRF